MTRDGNTTATTPKRAAIWRELPGGVWALGCVSSLMDVSSEMVHALLPVYLVTGLGASASAVGIIEGIAESTASITKVFSGALSDWMKRRKFLTALGYGMAAFTKPIFPLAPTLDWVIAARFIDRVGKGIRGAPRDALIADISPVHLRGASFGLRQSLDTVGAFAGPLLAIGLMWLTDGGFVPVFWIAVIPGFLAFTLVVVAVREPQRPEGLRQVRMPLSPGELRRLGTAYWWVVAVATVFTLARFSEAFLVLRAQSVGVPLMAVPAALVIMNIAYAISAYPMGVLSDRMDRVTVLVLGLLLLVAADLVLAFATGAVGVALGVLLWGLHMGFTQGLLATLIAEAAPQELRGTAFGMLNLVTGLALLAASVIAGVSWDLTGPQGTFLTGAAFAGLTLGGLLTLRSRLSPAAPSCAPEPPLRSPN